LKLNETDSLAIGTSPFNFTPSRSQNWLIATMQLPQLLGNQKEQRMNASRETVLDLSPVVIGTSQEIWLITADATALSLEQFKEQIAQEVSGFLN